MFQVSLTLDQAMSLDVYIIGSNCLSSRITSQKEAIARHNNIIENLPICLLV